MKFSISKKLGVIYIIMIMGLLGAIISNFLFSKSLLKQSTYATTISIPMAFKAKQMELHIIQVQQWLTDISATRAAEGYDDGFNEAQVHAEKFYALIEEFIAHYESKNYYKAVVDLKELKKDFDGYYEMGKEMAEAYIQKGPAKGNLFMEKFDPYAEKLANSINRFLNNQMQDLTYKLSRVVLSAKRANTVNILMGIFIIGLSTVIFFYVSMGIQQGSKEILKKITRISHGSLEIDTEAKSMDELGDIAHLLNKMSGNWRGMVRDIIGHAETLKVSSESLLDSSKITASVAQEMEQKANNANSASDRAATMLNAVSQDVKNTSLNVAALATATEEMSSNINTIADSTSQTSQNVSTVASAVDEMSTNIDSVVSNISEVSNSVNTVSSAIGEMSSSLAEVSKNCLDASRISSEANNKAKTTTEVIEKLKSSAQKIGKIVNVINDIADQTNMLALNATIEAAGAGEAGKGFAIVANEVKALAKQTADATEEIEAQIEEMQANTSHSVLAIEEIACIIEHINQINKIIASSVEEQTATTNEIAQSIESAAINARQVAENAQEIQGGVNEVAKSANEVAAGVSEIARSSNEVASAANEIAKESEHASKGVNLIEKKTQDANMTILGATTDIKAVNRGASSTGAGADMTISAAMDLSAMADKLSEVMRQFMIGKANFDIGKIKGAHLAFMRKLEAAISGKVTIKSDDIANAHECEFGKWYDHEGEKKFGDLPVFKETGIAHNEIHELAKEVASLTVQGKIDDARSLLPDLDRVRYQLFQKIDTLYRQNLDSGKS
ncbi:MAG: methyl-accepting chemotaxis protein [bacterium]